MKILQSKNPLEILNYVKHLLWDKQTIKELGEPIIYSEHQKWFLALEGEVITGFFVYEETNICYQIKYLYVVPEFRRLGIGDKLYKEFESTIQQDKPIRATTTKTGLEFFKKEKFYITLKYTNYFKVEKNEQI
jgi:GNAT superfamily N-acetyltransferase